MTYKNIIKKILFNDNLIHNQYIIIKKNPYLENDINL